MNILINQPFGAGDVVFCMTIGRRLKDQGHSITWPVFPQFVEGLQRAYPDIIFCDWRTMDIDHMRLDEHDWNGYRVIPLRHNTEILQVPYEQCMSSKYSLFNWDYKDWKEGAMYNRAPGRELNLCKLLNPKNEKYNLINKNYQSDFKGKCPIEVNNGNKNIYIDIIPGYSLFDYSMLLEGANEIHAVSSSILYLLELLDLSCPIHLYYRPTDPGFKQVDYLFTKNYILHCHNFLTVRKTL